MFEVVGKNTLDKLSDAAVIWSGTSQQRNDCQTDRHSMSKRPILPEVTLAE